MLPERGFNTPHIPLMNLLSSDFPLKSWLVNRDPYVMVYEIIPI